MGYSSGVVSSAVTLSHSPTAGLGFFGLSSPEQELWLFVPCICMQPVSLMLITKFEIDIQMFCADFPKAAE